ncbi:MAG: twin-arginine translocase subunit TatC [Bacteroidaceae bacterium]|nr:twin-arginine translocase subunit TatC [Bacteroidaceae bacterium]
MSQNDNMLTFGEHLEVLRKMLFRILTLTFCIAVVVFLFKDETFRLLLAPTKWNFATFRGIEHLCALLGWDFHFKEYHVELIATELSSQFMTHLTTSLYLGLLGASPYIMYELFRFVSPALYENERKYSVQVVVTIYLLFIIGVLMSYYVIFPISFRFLGTYQVSEVVRSTITLSSYISSFTTLTLVMGLVFQLPVIAFFLAKMGMLDAGLMKAYRRHAFMLILIVAAVITPPDVFTQTLVTVPLYGLYEISIRVVERT